MGDLFFVFDVESVGLHGEGFAYGFVVVDLAGKELESGFDACSPVYADGSLAGREWIRSNIRPFTEDTKDRPQAIRASFWRKWLKWKEKGALLAADCCWPVEARFLSACVDDERPEHTLMERQDDGPRGWEGPYPLVDVASVLLAKGLDPLGKFGRFSDELPEHDPLADARHSARLLVEALRL